MGIKRKWNMRKTIPVALFDMDGNEVARYGSIKECAQFFGIHHATLTYHIVKGNRKNGLLCKYIEEDVKPPESLIKSKPKPSKELDADKYRIIEYGVRFKRVCITPCPFKEGMEKILVGSYKCQKCPSFRGIDRENHKVACNYCVWSKL